MGGPPAGSGVDRPVIVAPALRLFSRIGIGDSLARRAIPGSYGLCHRRGGLYITDAPARPFAGCRLPLRGIGRYAGDPELLGQLLWVWPPFLATTDFACSDSRRR